MNSIAPVAVLAPAAFRRGRGRTGAGEVGRRGGVVMIRATLRGIRVTVCSGLMFAVAGDLIAGKNAAVDTAAARAIVAAAPATPAVAPVVDGMVVVPTGRYAPILRGKDEPESVVVPAFRLDERPVTNAEFLAFVQASPKWRRSQISPLFAEAGYLGNWAGDLELGPLAPADAPVVQVSWFAARKFAAWSGKRLPTTAEWERAAAVGFTSEDSAREPGFRAMALGWFGTPTPSPLPAAGQGRPNLHGVRDLLTLVWEWVDDFNSAMVTGESRADTGLERTLFCGAGAAGARDLENYPAFMRAGMRSSLRASYVVPNLGFRCAQNLAASPERVVAVQP